MVSGAMYRPSVCGSKCPTAGTETPGVPGGLGSLPWTLALNCWVWPGVSGDETWGGVTATRVGVEVSNSASSAVPWDRRFDGLRSR